jgi:hypothetical protein
LIWIKAAGIEDGNYEKVTTAMNPTIIVWDLETVPDLRGFAAVHDLAVRQFLPRIAAKFPGAVVIAPAEGGGGRRCQV